MLREPGDPSRIDDESPAIDNGRVVIDRATMHAPGDTGAHLLADRVEESARGVASVLRAVAEAITVQDTSGRLVYANDAAARMLGFEMPEALLAAPIADVVDRFELFDENGGPLSPLDLPGRLALAGREPPAMTVRFRIRATGEERWSIVRSTALVDADGRPTLAINAFQDITSRVLGEREALASRERLGQLVEALPVIAWTTDHDGRIIGSNGRWSEYTGSEPAIGRPIVDDASIHPDDLPGLVAAWGAARRAGTTFEAATRLRRLDGDYRWHLVRAVPASRHEDAPTTWIGTSTDIDDEKRSEERSRLLADAAARLDESLELDDTVRTAAALAIPRLADVAVIDLVGPDGSVRRGAIHAADRALRGTAARLADYPSIPGSDGAMGSVIASGRTLVLDGIDETMLAARTKDTAHADILRALATRSAVAIPLVARGRTLGAMALIRSAGRPSFDVRDVEVAEELARRAALAIDNASLYTAEGAARRAAEEAATRTNQLQQLTKALAGATDRAAVGRLVTGDTRSVLGAAAVGLYVTNRAGDVIEAVAIDGLAELQVEGWQEVRLKPDGPLSAVIGGSHEWWVENLATDPASPAFSALADALGAGAVVLLPVGTTDRVRGILGLFWPEPHTWTSDERDFIRAAADLAGQALERVGLAESRERPVLELDAARERLASVAESEHARAAELNAVIRSMGEAILVCDADGRIRLANPAAEDLLGDLDGRTYRDVLERLRDRESVAPALGTRSEAVQLRLADEQERWVEVTTYPVPPDDSETIVVLRDVTEARQHQAVRDTFIGVLSHELRTPLTTIFAGSKVLARHSSTIPPEQQRAIFTDIHDEAERLHRLVEDVVALTRFGEPSGDIGNEPVLIQRLLGPIVTAERARWPGVAFELHVAPALPTVVADPTYVEQVVRNLLSNAAKYGGAGRVEVRADHDGDEVLVRVLDEGPGFPEAEADRLFELFFRSSTTAARASGAGIGLFVASRLAKAMGGRIWARRRDGGGAEFGFALRVMAEE